jgi:superfamily I DNA/RNA helicase
VQPLSLSDEQQGLVGHADGHLFAEACPGAGKTRAIVARYLRRAAEEPRKGIALLSFTNAAIDEVRRRCGDRPDALKAPHFVGTFDSFINRFVSRPLYVRYYDKTPRFIESWQDSKHGSFRLPDMDRLPDFQLDWFMFDYAPEGQLRATLVDSWIPLLPARLLKNYIIANRTRLEDRAVIRCRTLVTRHGLLSCAASRAMATGLLQRPTFTQRFGQLLANRFSEVIVDEAQDCGPEELLILKLLKQYGVAMVAVADLDQSIFAFRRADPDGVRAFVGELGTPLALNGNYRSSPAICALNNRLRYGGRAETASGENASCELPVLLLEYRNQDEVAPAIDVLLAVHDRSRSETVFLAHRESDAQACAGVRSDRDSRSSNSVLGVAWAHAILRSGSSTSADRLRAVRMVEKTLRNAANVDDEDEAALEERWLRDAAYRLAASLDPAGSAAKAYAQKVRDYVKQIPWPVGIIPKDNLGTFLKAPPDSAWLTSDEDASAAVFPFATIHSVKGREFPTAVVVLPQNLRMDSAGQHVLDHWDQGIGSEARRVLYVGASRAQTLLILAVHADHADRVAELLKRDGVPYDLASLSAKPTGVAPENHRGSAGACSLMPAVLSALSPWLTTRLRSCRVGARCFRRQRVGFAGQDG